MESGWVLFLTVFVDCNEIMLDVVSFINVLQDSAFRYYMNCQKLRNLRWYLGPLQSSVN